MMTFVLLFTITFLVISMAALLINHCKQQANKTRHGLTGMCHKSGGVMCSSCTSQYSDK